MKKNKKTYYLLLIGALILIISTMHYKTPTSKWQFHLFYMQAYFVPIILAAFVFGVRGGLGSGIIISVLYFPHIMMHWGGLVEDNLVRFLQILLFNVLGYVTGLKAEGEKNEKEKFQDAARELERSLDALKIKTEQIFEMDQQLRAAERLTTIGELTASLAHEVRNPLGSIRGAVEIIRDAVPEEVKKLEFFDILIQDTQRLNEVVENYLSFAGRQPHDIKTFNLKEIINNIMLMIGARIRKSGIKLILQISEQELVVKSDPTQIWQALMNVLLNAIQAMPHGGDIHLIAEKQNDARIKLLIRDQGSGISAQEQSKIFDAFFTTKTDGSGLGLAIVKRLAEENNWEIDLKSTLGKGSDFTFLIPVEHKMR